jgi:hypothetical protein
VVQIDCSNPLHDDVVAALERRDSLGYTIAATHVDGPQAVRDLRGAVDLLQPQAHDFSKAAAKRP